MSDKEEKNVEEKDKNIENKEGENLEESNKENSKEENKEEEKSNGEEKKEEGGVEKKEGEEKKEEKKEEEGVEKKEEVKELTEEERKQQILEEKKKKRNEMFDFLDKGNYKKYYTMVEEGFGSDHEYILKESMNRAIDDLKTVCEGNLIVNEERTLYFIDDVVNSYVSSIIRRKDLTVEGRVTINPVLQYSLKIISINFEKEMKSLITAFGRIFEKRYFHVEESSFLAKKFKGLFESAPEEKYASSKKTQLLPIWAANINFFGENGGFDNILKTLSKETPERIQLSSMKNILAVVEKVKNIKKKINKMIHLILFAD